MSPLINQPEQSGSRRQSLFLLDKSVTRDELSLSPPCPDSASEVALTASQVDDHGNGKHLENQDNERPGSTISQQPPNDILLAETGAGLGKGEDGHSISEDLAALSRPGSPASVHTDNHADPDGCMAQDPSTTVPSSSLDGDLLDAFESTEGRERRDFLPIDALDRIVTKDRVNQEILKLRNTPPTELDRTVSQIWNTSSFAGQTTSRKKLFAILALIDKLEAIWDFIDEEIYDVHLPFKKPEGPIQARRRKGRTELSCRAVPESQEHTIRAFNGWKDHQIISFENRQWEVCVPIFFLNSKEKATVPHYTLQSKTILPFIQDDETKQNGTAGGFSDVWRVMIHPSHHNPGMLAPNKVDPPSVAIKRLRVSNENAFKIEVQNLKRFSKRDHLHLIKLLGTYHWRDQYYLIFPWADGNLLDFWKSHQTPIASRHDREAVLWFSKQCLGMVEGVKMIHKWDRPVTAGDTIGFSFPVDKTHGLHGDLKPENILWFKQDEGGGEGSPVMGHFKITDFGLSHFHRSISVANIDVAKIGLTPTYRAPETDVKHQISQSYDIWSLGCVFLESISWYLGGWPHVKSFTDRRAREDIPRYEDFFEDRFFNSTIHVSSEGGDTKRYAVGKRSVIEEFEKLYKHPDCSDYIADVLELIDTKILRVRPENRINCDEIASKLNELHSLLQRDPDYGIKRLKKPPLRASTLDSILINGENSTDVLCQVLQNHKTENTRESVRSTFTTSWVSSPAASLSSTSLVMITRSRSPSPPGMRSGPKVRFSQDLSSVQELPDSQGSQETEQYRDHSTTTTRTAMEPRTRSPIPTADNHSSELYLNEMAQESNTALHSQAADTMDFQYAVHEGESRADACSNDARNTEGESLSHPELEEQKPSTRITNTQPESDDGPTIDTSSYGDFVRHITSLSSNGYSSIASGSEAGPVSECLVVPRDVPETSSGCPTLLEGVSDCGHSDRPVDHRDSRGGGVPRRQDDTMGGDDQPKMRILPGQGDDGWGNHARLGRRRSTFRRILCFV